MPTRPAKNTKIRSSKTKAVAAAARDYETAVHRIRRSLRFSSQAVTLNLGTEILDVLDLSGQVCTCQRAEHAQLAPDRAATHREVRHV
jgi:hypothetical protein